MLPLCRVGRKNENFISVFTPFENHHQKPSGAGIANSPPGTAIGRLDSHPELKDPLRNPLPNSLDTSVY